MQRQAFSLVELSIVLVILGLLVGGILAGQSLIRAGELRQITTSADKFRTANFAFRDKYFAIPGDMNNATSFWGTLAGDGYNAACQDTEATGLPTCNGNGDKIVDSSSVVYAERFRFWQHLGNAGLVEGRFTGRTDSSTSGSFVLNNGKNSPIINGGGSFDPFTFSDSTSIGAANGYSFSSRKMGVTFLAYRGPNGLGAALRPEEVWNIDTKLDDGKPGLGRVNGPQKSWAGSPDCTTSDNPAVAEYDLTIKVKKCRFDIDI